MLRRRNILQSTDTHGLSVQEPGAYAHVPETSSGYPRDQPKKSVPDRVIDTPCRIHHVILIGINLPHHGRQICSASLAGSPSHVCSPGCNFSFCSRRNPCPADLGVGRRAAWPRRLRGRRPCQRVANPSGETAVCATFRITRSVAHKEPINRPAFAGVCSPFALP